MFFYSHVLLAFPANYIIFLFVKLYAPINSDLIFVSFPVLFLVAANLPVEELYQVQFLQVKVQEIHVR
jgi:hypothetical protein